MKVLRSRSRRLLIIMLSGLLCLALAPAIVVAAGVPAAHGVDGRDFGGLVSDLAASDPAALADHVGGGAALGGMPAAHGVDGRTFGGLVSDLAKSDQGAIADHVAGCDVEAAQEPDVAVDQGCEGYAGGVPEAHSLTGREFGEAVSGLVTSDPAALVAHVRGCR